MYKFRFDPKSRYVVNDVVLEIHLQHDFRSQLGPGDELVIWPLTDTTNYTPQTNQKIAEYFTQELDKAYKKLCSCELLTPVPSADDVKEVVKEITENKHD